MSNSVARIGDSDNFGHTISGGGSTNVTVNGLSVALQGSTMDDGATINGGVSGTVRINGRYAATMGSTTTPHPNYPGRNQSGTIIAGSPTVTVG